MNRSMMIGNILGGLGGFLNNSSSTGMGQVADLSPLQREFENDLTGSRSEPYSPVQGLGMGMGQGQPLQQYGQYLDNTYDNFDERRNAFLSNVREQEQQTFGQNQNQFQFQPFGGQGFRNLPPTMDQLQVNTQPLNSVQEPIFRNFLTEFNQGGAVASGTASFVPQQTQIMGQPHRLAYVNPQEEQMMLDAGGAGLPGPGGIPAYWTLTEPSTWGDGQGYQGVGNFNASDNNSAATSNDDNNNSAATNNDDDNDRVGFVDSIAMGFGFKDKTPAYYNTTAQTIAANQGQTAAQNYLQGLADDGDISSSSLGIFSDAASQVSLNPTLQSNDDNNNVVDSVNNTVVDETGTDETVDGEEEIQYTQMKPFYGGYQPSTIASTLVPSQLTRPTGPNPRLDPIYPTAFTSSQALTNPNIDQATNLLKTTPLSSPQNFASGMTETNPLTGLPSQGLPSQGQFSSLAELDAFQQQNPSANLMTEYQRLRALSGDIPAVAPLPNRGIASIFGNEQAPQYMYQGIMG